jgi:predicted transcriptional regulator
LNVYKVYIIDMSKSAVITARISEETLARVDKVAKVTGRTRAWFAAQAIREVADRELAYHESVQRGLDDADAGRTVPHEQVMAEIGQMIERHRARCPD